MLVKQRVRNQRTEHYTASYCHENVPGYVVVNAVIQFMRNTFIQTVI